MQNFHSKRNQLNKSFVIVCVFPQWIYAQVQAFVQQDVIPYRRIWLFCLFFINGQLAQINNLGGHRLIGCHSITSRIAAETRNVCARANDLNITYCENHRLLNEGQGDIGIANVYARQRDDRLRRQLEYNQQLLRMFEQQQ